METIVIQKLLDTAYTYYEYEVFPEFKDCRGATRLKLILDRMTRRGLQQYNGTPTSIFDAGDWDNLLILDACRHDTYEQVTGQSVPKRVTLGSHSAEYIERTYGADNQTCQTCNDIVYITANPHFADSLFTDLTGITADNLFHDVYHAYLDKWDDQLETVRADSILEDAANAQERYPDKRKILHFMQPHYPFIPNRQGRGFTPSAESRRNVWELCERGELDGATAREAYRDNLAYVLDYVEQAADLLPGTTVVTADHGNLLGEAGRYGHPQNCRAKPVREVPWHVLE